MGVDCRPCNDSTCSEARGGTGGVNTFGEWMLADLTWSSVSVDTLLKFACIVFERNKMKKTCVCIELNVSGYKHMRSGVQNGTIQSTGADRLASKCTNMLTLPLSEWTEMNG